MNLKGSSAKMPKAGRRENIHSSPQTKSTKTFNEIVEGLGDTFIRGFFEMMSAFGLGGTLTLLLAWFINSYATEGQKREIIDKWIIMQNGGGAKTMGIVVILLGVLVILGQWKHYQKKIKTKDEEIGRHKAEIAAYRDAIKKIKMKNSKKGVKK